MYEVGSIVVTETGRRVQIMAILGAGGEGVAYQVMDLLTGEIGVVKIFAEEHDKNVMFERTRFLISLRLDARSPALIAPIEAVVTSVGVGHYSRLAPGHRLDEEYKNITFNFYEGLLIALRIARSVDVLHRQGIAYGDINSGNYLITKIRGQHEVSVIDFDNFAADGVPKPPMRGHEKYLPPELREELASGWHFWPSIQTDLYELSVLLHEIILACHPGGPADVSEAEFLRAMSGRWIYDPMLISRIERPQGYSPFVLNSDLCRLFRRGLSSDPEERPAASEWVKSLTASLDCVDICDTCGYPSIIDSGKVRCPIDRHPFPPMKLVTRDTGRTVNFQRVACVGRSDLGGSNYVSGHHATVQQFGSGIMLESYGRNGTYRWNGRSWVRIPDHIPVVVRSGEKLRFADVEVMVTR